jgi:3-oxoacyl-[acyl-carrier-protein] synthase I
MKANATDERQTGRPASTAVTAHSLVSAAGVGLQALVDACSAGHSALQPNTFTRVPLATWAGEVAPQHWQGLGWQAQWAEWDCRANRLAWLGLQADGFISAAQTVCTRWGAARVGLVLGTSASTIGASELAYRTLDQALEQALDQAPGGFPAALRSERLNTLHAVAAFVQQVVGLQGPCCTVSTACSSSAKAFAQADRWLRLGLCDAVVVGGVDALCDSVFFGFNALQLLAPGACAPFAAARCGISVGEAAGFALLQRVPDSAAGAVQLLGHGEANDAHHMSAPHPQGRGAEAALNAALAHAGLHAHAVQHLQLHGTGTPQNDAVEAALVARRYAPGVHASATKGVTGHTMGAAGLVGALLCVHALQTGQQAGTVGTVAADPNLPAPFAQQLRLQPAAAPGLTVQVAASHAFGFGGNNCVLVFRAAA